MKIDWWSKYVGTPFLDGGRSGTKGLDCWGLVRAVYKDQLCVDLPSYGEISAHDLKSIALKMNDGSRGDNWLAATHPRSFDVVLMSSGRGNSRSIVHVGVAIDTKRMLHVEQASNANVVHFSSPFIRGRILGFRRRC